MQTLLKNPSQIKWVCHHLHIDKSNTINSKILKQSLNHMKEKWHLMSHIKKEYTEIDLYHRMDYTIHSLYTQNCHKLKTFIDVDSTVGMLPMLTALKLKEKWAQKNVDLQIGTQPLGGLETKQNIKLFKEACVLADFVGCLPSRDKKPKKHLDIAFETAASQSKHIEAHLDQCNLPTEKETELFCNFVEKYNYQGKARAIHCISLACHPREYQNKIASLLHQNDIGVIICPSAAISMFQDYSKKTPIHNSIAPLAILLKNNVNVGLGVDNIKDIFMPFCDGDLTFELRLLAEATRIYKPDVLLKIATNDMGFK